MFPTNQRNGFLKWAGSKRQLLPRLIEHAPEKYSRYIEPFAGSACLFFELRPRKAILADINPELVHAFRQIKGNPGEVSRVLREIPTGEDAYYRVRQQDPAELGDIERAARFVYLNRFCFNGLYRTNASGAFNVAYGGKRSGSVPNAELLKSCSEALRHARIIKGSFESTLEWAEKDDFVYIDPPYSIKARRVFSDYSWSSFGEHQLAELKRQLKRLDRTGAKFLVSYGYSREALQLGKGFHIRQAVVHRQIAGFADRRRRAREILITNY